MSVIDEIRARFKHNDTYWSGVDIAFLLTALDSRDKELRSFVMGMAGQNAVIEESAKLLAGRDTTITRLEAALRELREVIEDNYLNQGVAHLMLGMITKALAPDGGEKIDCFIGDKIKDKIREGGQPPVVDKATLAEAKEEADIYLSESKPVCGTCNGSKRVWRNYQWQPCDCTEGGDG